MADLNDTQLLRYARNILLNDVDIAGQQSLLASRVVVVGAGGLGSPVLQYLAAAGVGQLILIDDDSVDETNLQRQVLFNEQQVGQAKVSAAKSNLQALNSGIEITTHQLRLTADNVEQLLQQSDLVIVGTDNIASRLVVNQYCREHKTPLVSGAAIGFSGQVTSFDFRQQQSPCLACVYPNTEENLSCAESGVLGPVVGTIGSVMAVEAIKLLLNIGQPLLKRLLVWDAMAMQWQTFEYGASASCRVCGEH
ncbi:HesA/MoeB/ThiF family protein [Reinekea thalattae]|uniref:Molybdopterin-synthase adenylyltransferase n=1 Tax=Reinekea thalattae TaxID=2593301 RepID=A0A5C8ZAR2_9GAMM|nr:molybdopterin-synthase adenylyltransferase MoeB [Reinekea thalattae]TXR53986.1 molybdopterin-synthase adenylyltransferase MoeB [Reinekea thalattae]